MRKKETPILVVHFKSSDTDEYFGSVSALYEKHTADELGVTKQSLYNAFSKQGAYENKTATFVKSIITRSSGYGQKKED